MNCKNFKKNIKEPINLRTDSSIYYGDGIHNNTIKYDDINIDKKSTNDTILKKKIKLTNIYKSFLDKKEYQIMVENAIIASANHNWQKESQKLLTILNRI